MKCLNIGNECRLQEFLWRILCEKLHVYIEALKEYETLARPMWIWKFEYNSSFGWFLHHPLALEIQVYMEKDKTQKKKFAFSVSSDWVNFSLQAAIFFFLNLPRYDFHDWYSPGLKYGAGKMKSVIA